MRNIPRPGLILLSITLFLVISPDAYSALPAVTIISPNDFNYLGRSQIQRLDFNILDPDNGTDMNANIYMDSLDGKDSYLIREDLNLMTAGQCADNNFLDSTSCYYDWNTVKGYMIDDGNSNQQKYAPFVDDATTSQAITNLIYPGSVIEGDAAIDLGCDVSSSAINACNFTSVFFGGDVNYAPYFGTSAGKPTRGTMIMPIYVKGTLDPSFQFIIRFRQNALNFVLWNLTDENLTSSQYTILQLDLANVTIAGNPTWESGLHSFNLIMSYDAAQTDYNLFIDDFHLKMPDGNYFLDVNAYDGTGWGADLSDSNFVVDNTAPFTLAVDYNRAVQPDNVDIVLSCSDPTSGCSSTEYKLDTDGTASVSLGAWTAFSGSIGVTGDGNWAVAFRSTDVTGNVEDTNTIYVVITTPPKYALSGSSRTMASLLQYFFPFVMVLVILSVLFSFLFISRGNSSMSGNLPGLIVLIAVIIIFMYIFLNFLSSALQVTV